MKLFFLVLFSLMISSIWSQSDTSKPIKQSPTIFEGMGGQKASRFMMVYMRQLPENPKFGVFNLINYEVDYTSTTPDKYFLQTLFTYKLSKRFNIGLGGNLKSVGSFKPTISSMYGYFSKSFACIIQPDIELHKKGEAQLFSMFEWVPQNKKKIQFYSNVKALASANYVGDLTFKYLFLRIGIQYKYVRFGPALNFHNLVCNYTTTSYSNYGFFMNIVFK